MNRIRACSAFKNVAFNRSVAAPVIESSIVRCMGIFVLLAVMFAAGMPAAGGQGSATTDLVAVKTTQPQQVTLRRSTTQPATVRAFFEAELYAKVGGYLKKLHVDIGDQVEEGQKLAEIDVPEMLKGYQRQEAEVTRLQSEKVRYGAAIEVARAKLEQAQAGVKEAQARVAANRSEYKRIEELVESKATTQRLRDETLNRLQASQAALSS